MKIVTLSEKDLIKVLELENNSAPDAPFYLKYDEKALRFIFDESDKCEAVGMYDGGKLIAWGAYRSGWSEFNKDDEVFEISSIVVDKKNRKQGLGTKILHNIVGRIKSSKKYSSIYLTVYPRNKEALLMYLKNDFVIFDFKTDIYGPGGDRLFLKLDLKSI